MRDLRSRGAIDIPVTMPVSPESAGGVNEEDDLTCHGHEREGAFP